MKYIYILIILCFSCKNNNEKLKDQAAKNSVRNENTANHDNSAKDSVGIGPRNDQESILKDIDVQFIKANIDDVTTSFIPKSKSKFFPDKKRNQFYAAYFLIKKAQDSTSNLIGRMVVYDSINPKIYTKTTEEFIEITLVEKGIILYDKFEVGMSEKKLFGLINKRYNKHGNTLEFRDKKYRAFFKINDNVITKIKIGIYRDNINTDEMLKAFNWDSNDGF